MLTVSTASWFDPYLATGTTWSEQTTTSEGGTNTFITTNKGPTTFNGVSCTEFDESTSKNGPIGFAYGGQDSAGDYVQYGENTTITTTTTATQTDTYTPYEVDVPATLTAGVPVTFTDSDANTLVNSAGNTSVIYTDTNVFTLLSETPTSITVPAGTYSAYEVQEVSSTVGSDGSTSGPDTSDTWYAPGVGAVQGADQSSGLVSVLVNFTAAYHLAVTPPANTLVDDTIPAVQVSIQNSSGAIDTNAADAVTITASIAPGSTGTGTLSGTSSVTTVGGVATFSDLSINKPGQYILNFSDSAGRTVSSASFEISAGKLRFKGRVSNGVAGSSLDPAVEIELVNSKGKIITDDPSLVTLSISGANSSNPITGNTAELVDGVAIFSTVKLGAPGDHTLNATDGQGDASAASNQFEITGLHLAFRKQPAEVSVNAPLRYELVLEDSKNRLVNNSSVGLALTLNTIEGGTGAHLSSSADTVDFGVASNTGADPATINSPGTYTVTFTVISQGTDAFDYTIDPITSDPFKIGANHLEFVKQPLTTGAAIPLVYEIAMENYQNKIVKTSTDELTFTLIPSSGQSDGVLASSADTLIGGTAMNANQMVSISAPGTYKLSVVDVPANPSDPVALSVTSALFRIKAAPK